MSGAMAPLGLLLIVEAAGILSFGAEGDAPERLSEAATRAFADGRDDEALELLRRLQQDHPDHEASERDLDLIERLARFTFAKVPDRVFAGQKSEVTQASEVAAFRLHRVDPGALRRSFETDPGARRRPSPERSSWTPLGPERAFPIDLGSLEPGAYVLEETVAGFRKRHRLRVEAIAVLVHALAGKGVACAVNPLSGAPIDGVDLELRSAAGSARARTGSDGLAFLEPCGAGTLIAWKGSEVVACSLKVDGEPAEELVYLTTDRPIYRPGQTVHFKAVHRVRRGVDFSFRPGEKVRVELRGKNRRLISSHVAAWSAAGTISGSFDLGARAPGYYEIVVGVPRQRRFPDDERSDWSHRFKVEAYRKPDFQVDIGPLGAPPLSTVPLLSEPVRLEVTARYFFDQPVVGAPVRWSVDAFEPGRLPWGQRLLPEDPRSWVFDDRWSGDAAGRWRYRSFRAIGRGTTGADGRLEISVPTPPETLPLELQVDAYVNERWAFGVHQQKTVTLQAKIPHVSLATPFDSYCEGELVRAFARVIDADGKPAAGWPIELAVYKSNNEEERELEPLRSLRTATSEEGMAAFELPAPDCRSLRLTARAKDAAGRLAQASVNLSVAGPRRNREGVPAPIVSVDERVFSPGEEEALSLNLVPERALYAPGDTLRLFVQSSPVPLDAIIVIEGSTIEAARRVRINQALEVLELPVGNWPRPHQTVYLFAFAEGMYSTAQCPVTIVPARSHLEVEVAADRAAYRPGEKMRISVSTRVAGKPAPAEVELSVVDEAIFGLRPDRTPDIRRFFHADSLRYGETACTLPQDLRRARGGGGGLETPNAARDCFPDTLYWNGRLETGPDGRAEVEVEAPGSLTTWRITARGVSGTDLFGAARSPAISKKDVVARLIAPRFLTERDESSASVILHNYLEEAADFTVRLLASGSVVGERSVRAASGETRRLSWPLPRAVPGSLRLRAEAFSPLGSDAMELELPVRPHGMEEEAAIGGKMDGRWTGSIVVPEGVSLDTAVLEISVAGAGLSAVRDALPFLARYPHGCVEQTLSRFLPAVAAARAMRELGVRNSGLEEDLPVMVEKGLERLYALERSGGGWGWWSRGDDDTRMTAYVVQGLARARSAGFPIDAGVLERGVAYLRRSRLEPAALLARAAAGDEVEADLAKAVPRDANEAALLVLAGRRDLAKQLPAEPPAERGSSEIEATALVARALASVDRADPRLEPLLAWILAARRGAAWWSTLDTAQAVLALTEAARGEGDNEPARISVNGTLLPASAGTIRVPPSLLRNGDNSIEVVHEGTASLFASALLRSQATAEALPARPGSLRVSRRFERSIEGKKDEAAWTPIGSDPTVKAGEMLRLVLWVESPRSLSFVFVESPLPGGTEPVERGHEWLPTHVEVHDDRVATAVDSLSEGSTEFTFMLVAAHPGTYHVLPASAFAMYDPRERGRSDELILRVLPRE